MTDVDPLETMDHESVEAFRDAIQRLKERGYAASEDDLMVVVGDGAWRRFNGDYADMSASWSPSIDGIPLMQGRGSFPDERMLIVDKRALNDVDVPAAARGPTMQKGAASEITVEDYAITASTLHVVANPAAIEFVPEFEV